MTDERIIAYLLEELPAEELEQFEDECFAQTDWPEQIDCVEEDLIDAYLRRDLTPKQSQLFEKNYLSTETRQQRVLIAAALLRRVDEQASAVAAIEDEPKPSESWIERLRAFWNHQSLAFRVAAPLALLACIALTVWLFIPKPPQSFALLSLPITVRSDRAEGIRASKVSLPLNADALKISLMLPEPASTGASYRAELFKSDGVTTPLKIAGQDSQSISVVIPASQVARGQYAIKLFITKPNDTERRINGSYFFTVE